MLNIDRRKKYTGIGNKSDVNKSENYIDINFDLQALNLMCCYLLSENRNIRRSHLINMRNLFSIINMDLYRNDIEKIKRISFIKKGLEAKLVEGLKDPYIIIKYINGGIMDTDVIDPANLTYNLSTQELEWINQTISESLKYSFMNNYIDDMIDVCTRFKSSDFATRGNIVKEFEALVDDVKNSFRRTKVESMTDTTFSLREGYFQDNIRDIHAQLKNPSSKVVCGMQGLNEITSGGFENGRVYMLFGASGDFKSGTLLSLAYQIKKYNKCIKPKDPTKIPCIVLLTQENTVKETVERLFNMATVSDDIRTFEADEVIRLLQQEGELYLNDESPIDIIIKYKPNGSIDTGYLYTLVEDLEDDGYECICLIQDYVKRIRSTYKQPDIRLELGEIVNEFKVFAAIKDIPVISASQLNRDAARTIDEGARTNKADLTRMLGRSNVGESMLMIDNLDWASIIHREYDSSGNMYLVFFRMKIRYKASDRDYFCQPFVVGNDMKLVEDYYLPVPVFRDTLKDNAEGVIFKGAPVNGRQTVNSNGRRNIEDILAEKTMHEEDDNIFSKSRYRQSNSNYSVVEKTTMPLLVGGVPPMIQPISFIN